MSENNNDQSPPSSALSRSFKLFSMVSKIAAREVVQRISGAAQKKFDELSPEQLKRRVDQAKIITESLSQLKGAAMKAGQLLSIDASGFLPPEAIAVLSKLQNQSVQMPFNVVEKQIRAELGDDRYADLKNLSYRAEAAASIGQVHSASLNGQKVAIKVQYPGISRSIDADLGILKRLAEYLLKATGREIPLSGLFEELKTVLEQEVDYRRELQLLNRYAAHIVKYPAYQIPKTFPEYSSEHVLTMSFEQGVPLATWLATQPSLELRQHYAKVILDLYIIEFVEMGLVQTDPNFANFLINESERKLVVLDFGATLEFDSEFKTKYAKVLDAVEAQDFEMLKTRAFEFGLLDPREPEEALRAFENMMRISLMPFSPTEQPFNFSNLEFEKQTQETTIAFTRSLRYSAPPRKIIFLHRKLGGIFNLLKRMDISMDLRPYWERMLNELK